MSKGSRQRSGDTTKFSVNYDSIFGDKHESDRQLPKKEKEGRGRSTTVTAEHQAATI
jgi:hypothetical protein|tara:strand:+ start:388 stop:558 length:171 start_codon:yes stop_codon:yes gene_type:complete